MLTNYFMEQVADTTPNAIYIFDLKEFKTVYVNREILNTLGYTQQETYQVYERGAEGIRRLIHPDDYGRRTQHYLQFGTARDKEVREVKFRMKHADGRYRHFLVRNAVFRRGPGGMPSQIIGISQDITRLKETEHALQQALRQLQQLNEELLAAGEELRISNEELGTANQKLQSLSNGLEKRVAERTAELERVNAQLASEIDWRKKREDELRLSEQRLRIALSTLPITVFQQDATLRYIWYFNSQVGFTPEEMLGKTDSDLLSAEEAAKTIALKQTTLRSGTRRTQELALRLKGEERIYLLTLEPIFGPSGQVTGLTGATLDITGQKRDEATLRHALLQVEEQNKKLDCTLTELRERNEALDQYVYKVSHDIRSPVASITGLLNLIEEDPQETGKYLGLIRNRVGRLDEFIQSVLSHSKSLFTQVHN